MPSLRRSRRVRDRSTAYQEPAGRPWGRWTPTTSRTGAQAAGEAPQGPSSHCAAVITTGLRNILASPVRLASWSHGLRHLLDR